MASCAPPFFAPDGSFKLTTEPLATPPANSEVQPLILQLVDNKQQPGLHAAQLPPLLSEGDAVVHISADARRTSLAPPTEQGGGAVRATVQPAALLDAGQQQAEPFGVALAMGADADDERQHLCAQHAGSSSSSGGGMDSFSIQRAAASGRGVFTARAGALGAATLHHATGAARATWAHFYQLMSPPMVACLLALLVGTVPMLRSAFFDEGGALRLITVRGCMPLQRAYCASCWACLAVSVAGGVCDLCS